MTGAHSFGGAGSFLVASSSFRHEMPLFVRPDRYVNVPLEPTYQAAYRGMPAFWRAVLEGRTPEVP